METVHPNGCISPRIVFSNQPDLDQIVPDESFFLIGPIFVLNRLQSSPFFDPIESRLMDHGGGGRITDVPRTIDTFPGRKYAKVRASTRRYTAKAR